MSALILNNLCYTLEDQHILRDLNLRFEGCSLGIVGHNGCGKSTLAHLLNGMRLPTQGSITIANHHLTSQSKFKSLHLLRKNVALVQQFSDKQLFALTVKEELFFATTNFKISAAETTKRIARLLPVFQLPITILAKNPMHLSGGEKRKISILSMLLLNPKILILDEPTLGLDASSKKSIFETLNEFQLISGLKLILISHEMDLIYNHCSHVLEIEKGKIISFLPKHDFFQTAFLSKRLNYLPDFLQYGAIYNNDLNTYNLLTNGILLKELLKHKNDKPEY